MKKLKIAYLSVFYPFRGGIAQFNNELFLALSKHCEVKAFNFSRQYPNLLFPGKTQLVAANDPDPTIESQPCLDSINPVSYFSTAKAIKNFKPDVIFTAYWMPFFAPSLGTVLRQFKGKKIGLLHNVIPHEKGKLDDVLNRYYLKQNNGFVVLSDTVEKQLKSYFPEASCLQVQHPLYRHFGEKINKQIAQQQLNIPTGKKIVLFFGFIRKYKGLDLAIEALSKLDEDVCLLIAGESYEKEDVLQKQIKSFNLEDRVFTHVRYISDEEVKFFFSAADLCVLPYRTATQSGIASIAKHFELPMVVTPVGELPNEVQHLKTGYVCKEVSSAALKEGIEFSLSQLELFSNNQRKDNNDNSFDNFALKLVDYLHK